MEHHAYYIEGSLSLFEEYKKGIKPLGRSPAGETFWARKFERFGVDDARELAALATLKNYSDTIFFVGISSFTTEAQQALLKLIEEPQYGTTFILLVPHGILLSTLRSRMLEYPAKGNALNQGLPRLRQGFDGQARHRLEFQQTIDKFLKSNKKERSEFVVKLIKDDPPRLDGRVEAGEGTKDRAREFINALELELYYRFSKFRTSEAREDLEDIAKVRDYMRDRSPSLKMLLEHLAVSLLRM
ncbi:hypothetical protein A2852_02135 [Candidatus Adlerbacteria bacterium RIFCSPHIGHO2_01_FULL_54_23]|uniref:Uncharacterized protein n=3 Tax=Candidatus Adleribacteriota TaxID=1752736 RepID=A0A1F4Y110_9BACT|nr:MAG: poymerase III subunit delta' protein [Candidatus Adlerbacteria bacterium GW2011_GWA1_54_10]KKW37917.1 MAG: poymerase III subunit delta' protein [Candidatus Adlerbacteria bacterium GW2011_GWB1_54_7]OGC78528.1 MAG: hypothetical protein A2852_02135 [Candidatus Adlerbacteria bacterium RIFCSPHIGHO2_01_FULL_54_23]OGC87538.1 MAG: hypothetical protein A3B33_01325 [Candidatus Adlerbacteria bacterium RIFCSPLOWO2_01_FULL_54_16]